MPALVFAGLIFGQQPNIGGCSVFPANNIWNTAIDSMPVHPNSNQYVSSMGSNAGIRYDTTMPVNIVPTTQPLVPINITFPTESDPGPYPIPPNAQVEGGDFHVIVVDQTCWLYETYNSVLQPNGSWNVDSAAHWNLASNALRPAGWTSADGAGLPIMPGLMRYSEVLSGQINHALRMTAPATQANVYQWPARHYASHDTSTSLPMMGQRFRLKAGFDISGFSANMRVILRALKKYGAMIADNGLAWSLQGDTDPNWDPNDLLTLRQVAGSNWEAVDVSGLMISPDSGAALQPAAGAALSSVAVSPNQVIGGFSVGVTVALTAGAPASGASITLSGSNSAFPTTTVVVGAGLTSGAFSVPTAAVGADTAVTIQAAYNGATVLSQPLTVTAPLIDNCPTFPANNIWNTAVDSLPLSPNSANYVNSISATGGIRYDTTMPFNLVPGTQPLVPINISNPSESDPGPYPFPPNAQVEGGDGHVLVIDLGHCVLYETYNSALQSNGSWNVDSAAHWDLTSNALRPVGWTSADGAGLPIYPGLLRYAEMASGQINHALRFTAPKTQALYVWPARHLASTSSDSTLPPMGQRFRLKAGYDISSFSANMQVILRALKKYGMMVADNGLAWSLQGDTDPRWDPNDLLTLRQVVGSNMEAVDVSGLIVDINSGQAGTVAPPAALSQVTSLALSPSTVSGGSSVTGTVSLSSASPAGGLSVTVSSSNSAVIASTTLTVAAGAASGQFTSSTAAVTASTTVTLTASANGGTATSPLTVNPGSPGLQTLPGLYGISLSPTSVVGGSNVNVTVTLTAPASGSGATVSLFSANPAFPGVNVTVAAGAAQQTFSLPTAAVSAATVATIIASLGAAQKSADLTVTPGAVSPASQASLYGITLSPATVVIGSNVNVIVTLTAPAPGSGAQVALFSGNAAFPGTAVVVPGGLAQQTFSLSTAPLSGQSVATIVASYGGVQKSADLTLQSPGPSQPLQALWGISVAPTLIVGGTKVNVTVVLTSAAPASGAPVSLFSSSPAFPSTQVTVGGGLTQQTFSLPTAAVSSQTMATIIASYNTSQKSADLTIRPPS